MRIEIPSTVRAVTNYLRVYGTSDFNTSVSDYCTDTTTVIPAEIKTLYLHNVTNTYPMNTTVGNAPSTSYVQIDAAQTVTWNQTPNFALNFNIVANCYVVLYIEPAAGTPDVKVNLTYNDNSIEIDSDTILNIATADWYTFTITVTGTITISAGDKLTVNVEVLADSARVYYDSVSRASRLNLTTNTYIDIAWIKTYDLSGNEAVNFSEEETVVVRANITDPFGAYDIVSADLTLKYPNTTIAVQQVAMSVESEGAGWKIYRYDWSSMPDNVGDEYTIEVRGNESNGIYRNDTITFNVPVVVEPNRVGTCVRGWSVKFAHTIVHNGTGATNIELTVTSSRGWNVTLWSGKNIMAWDANGDGDYNDAGDWVNTSYDSDLDGTPDTGALAIDTTYTITVEAHLEVEGSLADFYVNLTATYDTAPDLTCNGSCTDTIGQIGRIVINEVASWSNGDIEADKEWIELYNADVVAIDISGWNITDQDGNWLVLGTLPVMPAGNYLLLNTSTGTNDTDWTGGNMTLYWQRSAEVWDDAGDDVLLLTPSGYAVD